MQAPSSLHDWLRSIGAVGTMLSAVFAVINYVNSTRKIQRDAQSDKARRIRERLSRISAEVQELGLQVGDGAAMISAAASVADEIERRMPTPATKEELGQILDDDGLMLSVSITGWYKSRAGTEISGRIIELQLEVSQLTGGLYVLSNALELLTDVGNDGFSPLIFQRILTILKSGGGFRQEIESAGPPKRMIDKLTVVLQANASAYFHIRYEDAFKTIREFLERFVNALSSLPDDKLVSIPAMALERAGKESRTDSITQRYSCQRGLQRAGPALPADCDLCHQGACRSGARKI
jgi:hypothetical protein